MKYTFSAKNPINHFLSVKVECEVQNQNEITIQLPAWRPGRYELGNFAKNVKDFKVLDEKGAVLPFDKISKDAWKVDSSQTSKLIIEYDYFANELNAGSTWLDKNQLYVNPVNCCVYVLGKEVEECEVELVVPDNFKVATSMKEEAKNLFKVLDFQELADTPFIASPTLQHKMYESNDIRFYVWFQGEVTPDWDRLLTDFQRYTDYQIEKFGSFPVKEYHFLNQITTYKSYHGVEHQKSTVIALGPSYDIFKKLYTEFLGVSSHELYHTWNIKAIRPEEMLPYDFSKENYSKLGYVAEGVTTYMGDRMLYESGVFDLKQYFKEFENYLIKHFHNDGRNHNSVANSSWDTWLDGYVQGIPGRKTSIYTEGALIAYICDMRIRKNTNNEFSLHNVMKELYLKTNQNQGYSENDYQTLLEKVAGCSFDDIFKNLIHGTADFTPYLKEAFSTENWEVTEEPSLTSYENYGIKGVYRNGVLQITHLKEGSSSEDSKLVLGDKIQFVNDIKVSSDLAEWLDYFKGKELNLSVERDGQLKKITLLPDNGVGYHQYKLSIK